MGDRLFVVGVVVCALLRAFVAMHRKTRIYGSNMVRDDRHTKTLNPYRTLLNICLSKTEV